GRESKELDGRRRAPRGVGELLRPARDLAGLLRDAMYDTAVWIHRRREVFNSAQEMEASSCEREVVSLDVVGITGKVLDRDDVTDTGEHALCHHGGADERARAGPTRRQDDAAKRLGTRSRSRRSGTGHANVTAPARITYPTCRLMATPSSVVFCYANTPFRTL